MKDVLAWLSAHASEAANLLVYGAIAIVTLIGVCKCLFPLWGTTHALRRAIRRLQDDAGQTHDVPVWQENRFMGRRLKGSWLRFLQNAEQLDRRGLPCAVEDYINDDTVTHGPGNATLAELIPSLLTSLGILGTFMGMTSGLGGLDPTSTETMMSGIKTLLSGMQFAFGTSVAGVSCSLVFNMLNRIAQGSSYRAIDDFVECFTQLAMQRPLDNDVQLICQNQDRNHLLGTVTETISGQMSASIESAIGRAMQPVAKSMDNFLIGATRAQVDGVGRIVSNFVEQMNASLSNQFLTLGQTMTEINQRQQLSAAQVDQSLHAAAQMLQNVQQLNGVSQDVINHFEHYIAELGDARRRDEGFEKNVTDVLGRMRQASDAQQAVIRQLEDCQEDLSRSMEQFTKVSRDSLTLMHQSSEENARQLTGTAKAMQDASRNLGQSYQSFVQNVVEGLSRALGMFDESMQGAVSSVASQLDKLQATGTDAETAVQASEMQRLLGDLTRSLERATEAMRALAPDKGA